MPTTYAHWRFGDKCISTFTPELRNLVERNLDIFNFGVHGPDIYFYYNCLKKNDVNRFGSKLHDIPFGETLEKIKPRYDRCVDKEAAIAYLLGFTCHFTLDSYCHGYIERKEEVSGISHGKLESQLDRYFLLKDGYDPVKTSVTFSLRPARWIADVIAFIFPEWDEKQTLKTLRDMRMYLDLLKDNSDIKRGFLVWAMDRFKVPAFKDLLITKHNHPEARDAMLRLDKLFENALEHYPTLAASLVDFLEDGEVLDPYFSNHFCPKPDYKEIPVLPLDEERKYRTYLQD